MKHCLHACDRIGLCCRGRQYVRAPIERSEAREAVLHGNRVYQLIAQAPTAPVGGPAAPVAMMADAPRS